MGDGTDGLVMDLIESAVMAGAYGDLAKRHPEAARGLGRMRAKYSGRVTALCSQVADRSLALRPRSL